MKRQINTYKINLTTSDKANEIFQSLLYKVACN